MCLVPNNLSLAPHTQPGAGLFLQHDCERQPDIAGNPELGPCLRWLILGGVAGPRAPGGVLSGLKERPRVGGRGLGGWSETLEGSCLTFTPNTTALHSVPIGRGEAARHSPKREPRPTKREPRPKGEGRGSGTLIGDILWAEGGFRPGILDLYVVRAFRTVGLAI
jgi:hypothetical protein